MSLRRSLATGIGEKTEVRAS